MLIICLALTIWRSPNTNPAPRKRSRIFRGYPVHLIFRGL